MKINPFNIETRQGSFRLDKTIVLSKGNVYSVDFESNQPGLEFILLLAGLSEHAADREFGHSNANKAERDLWINNANFVFLDDVPVATMPDKDRVEQIGLVFENPEWGFICNSAKEDIAFSFASIGLDAPSIYMLRKYGLWEVQSERPELLSGGEQQRLACFSVMERAPSICIFDFSSSNIDEEFRRFFTEWVLKTATESVIIIRGLDIGKSQSFNSISISMSTKGLLKTGVKSLRRFPNSQSQAKKLAKLLKPRDVGEPVLTAVNLLTQYGRTPISVKVNEREIVKLLGPNGSGKTTFLKYIASPKKKAKLLYKSGDMEVVDNLNPAIVFQHPEHSTSAFKLRNEVFSAEVLKILDIDPFWLDGPAHDAPRSVRKLISLATTCEMAGKLVLWDEPTVSLDPIEKSKAIALLNYYSDKSFLIVTHDEALSNIGRSVNVIDL